MRGSAGAVDNCLVRSDGTGAKTVQATGIAVDDSNNVSGAGTIAGTSFNSITGLSSTTPAALGTAAVGTGVTAARADHVHAVPTVQLCHYQATAGAASASTEFLVGSGLGYSVTEADSVITIGTAFHATAMYITHGTAVVDTIAYTFRVNAADSALTCTMASNGTAVNVTGQSVALAAGDKITLKSIQSSNTVQAGLRPRITIVGVPI